MERININKKTAYVVNITEVVHHRVVILGDRSINAEITANTLYNKGLLDLKTGGTTISAHFGRGLIASHEDIQRLDIYDDNGFVSGCKDEDYLEKAKAEIAFYLSTHLKEENPDFSNLGNIGVANTDYEESDYGPYTVQVYVDLLNLAVRTYVNDILVSTIAFPGIKEMYRDFLLYLDFDDLVYITDEEWQQYKTITQMHKAIQNLSINETQRKMLRAMYPVGTTIRLIKMAEETHPVPPGTLGKITAVDDAGHLHMHWNSGRTLSLIPGVDAFEIVY